MSYYKKFAFKIIGLRSAESGSDHKKFVDEIVAATLGEAVVLAIICVTGVLLLIGYLFAHILPTFSQRTGLLAGVVAAIAVIPFDLFVKWRLTKRIEREILGAD